MALHDLQKSTVAKLVKSEAKGGAVEFETDEAAFAGAFLEDAIGDEDLDEPDDAETLER